MKRTLSITFAVLMTTLLSGCFEEMIVEPSQSAEQVFIHPGMLHTRQDLARMKAEVAAGKQAAPKASLDFDPKPSAHVIRGPYGRPNIGGRALGDGANAAYKHALRWAITGEQAHADKAIEILNAWSQTLWDFDDNDSKLLAGWTGQKFCNAAELLRYTDAGWKQADIEQFERMLRTAYCTLIEHYFPEANGNWDAAMMNSILCIAIFCDDKPMFENTINHFLRGPGNSGITKYIYPTGQCQESTRDQAHTQLGLGELAGVCRVAWTQGVDLYGAADNRLALGFEYTAKYMLGEDVPCYGPISRTSRGKFRDMYGDVYRHYRYVKGLDMPYTKRAYDKSGHASVDDLGMTEEMLANASVEPKGPPMPSKIAANAGAQAEPTAQAPADAVVVEPGDSLQDTLDGCKPGQWVVLAKGLHTLPKSVKVPSGVTIAGQGIGTVLFLDPEETGAALTGAALINATPDLNNVTIRDLVIEGATSHRLPRDPNQDRRQRSYQMAPSRAGIAFLGERAGQMSNLRFEHVTVQNCTHNGVAIRGAKNVIIESCDFSDSGSSVVPGPGLQHNLLIAHSSDCQVRNSRLDTSPWGCGIDLSHCRNIQLTGNETARNAMNGIRVTESERIAVVNNLVEGSDQSGIRFFLRMDGNRDINIRENLIQNNAQHGIEITGTTGQTVQSNTLRDNGYTD